MSGYFNLDSNEAFLAGLLHNIGRIGLLKQISNHYNMPDEIDVEYHQSIFNNILPKFETKAAKKICEYWKLEDKIIRAITGHSELENINRSLIPQDYIRLTALVNLAVYLSRILGYGDSVQRPDVFNTLAAKILGFKEDNKTKNLLVDIKYAFETTGEEDTSK